MIARWSAAAESARRSQSMSLFAAMRGIRLLVDSVTGAVDEDGRPIDDSRGGGDAGDVPARVIDPTQLLPAASVMQDARLEIDSTLRMLADEEARAAEECKEARDRVFASLRSDMDGGPGGSVLGSVASASIAGGDGEGSVMAMVDAVGGAACPNPSVRLACECCGAVWCLLLVVCCLLLVVVGGGAG